MVADIGGGIKLDLNYCFPVAADGSRGPLPKQQTFLDSALDPAGAKYTLYCGGVGSGKTLIGCITVISWAVMHGGDYIIARQFSPELLVTTQKTFFELCPPELIIEHRVAERLVRLRSANGEATILFRGLDEPDKLRSLNLSGFYIDESTYVSEDSFLLLQGRLRNKKGLRKGILTSNPRGHEWNYKWFVKQDHLSDPSVKAQFALVRAPSTENTHLPEGYVKSMLGSWSEDRVQREIMGSFDAFEGAVYPEFRRDTHVIRPFAIPEGWTKVCGVDHGYRNPAAWVWGATDYDGNLYIYREFYEKEWLIEEICRLGKDKRPSVRHLMAGERIEGAYIDPSTRARRAKDGRSDWDWYTEYLPKNLPLIKANNAVGAGVDRLKSLFRPQPNGKPRIYIFDTCTNLVEELTNYRYSELKPGQAGDLNDKEAPQKVNDHACDALRYLAMSLPESTVKKEDVYEKIKYNSIEGSLFRELQGIKNPRTKDPFGD